MTPLLRTWAAENNIEFVYTPTYSSWLNQIECHFGPLRKFVLEGSDYSNNKELAQEVQAYLRWRNKNKHHEAILREQNKIKVV